MSGIIHVIAVIKPLPGKIDAVLEIIKPFGEYVAANEPGVLQYQYFKRKHDDGAEDVVFIEQYKDLAALETHKTSEAAATMKKAFGASGLLAAAPDIKVLKPAGGVSFRTNL